LVNSIKRVYNTFYAVFYFSLGINLFFLGTKFIAGLYSIYIRFFYKVIRVKLNIKYCY